MAEDLLLSYILPCYNTGPFIHQCIESLYNQGMDESTFEVIFVNNATEDNSEEIVLDIKREHSNLVYIKLEKNICAGGAYNAGLRVARGKYVQFVDSDDYISANHEKGILFYMEKENVDALYFNIKSFGSDTNSKEENSLRLNANFKNDIKKCNSSLFLESFFSTNATDKLPIPAYRKIINRQFLIRNNIFFTQTTIGTDFLHNIEILSKADSVAAVTQKLYCFRYNPSGVTKSKINSNKIVYALNNYTKSIVVVEQSSFSDLVKTKLICMLRKTMDEYVYLIFFVTNKELSDIYLNIEDIEITRKYLSPFPSIIIWNKAVLKLLKIVFNPFICNLFNTIRKKCH